MTKIKIVENGPALVSGGVKIETADGETVFKEKAALCRCGKSKNSVYCDGAHAPRPETKE